MSLLVFFALVVAAASSGALFAPGPWYKSLNKPSWTPPDWLFPVVWTILYFMIALAGWLVWRAQGWSVVIVVWAAGLALNALWSAIMFGRKNIALALLDVAALWLMTAAFIWLAWPLDWRAGLLFAPYLLWVSIATALNYAVWRMN